MLQAANSLKHPSRSFRPVEQSVRFSAKGDIGLSIDCVRCTRKTDRWLASRS
jgi:hypothetical protein